MTPRRSRPGRRRRSGSRSCATPHRGPSPGRFRPCPSAHTTGRPAHGPHRCTWNDSRRCLTQARACRKATPGEIRGNRMGSTLPYVHVRVARHPAPGDSGYTCCVSPGEMEMSAIPCIRWFGELRNADVPLVGGKNASLGEMYSALSGQGVRVPNGFAIVAQAYRDALTAAKAWEPLHSALDQLDKTNVALLSQRATRAREIVYAAAGTAELREAIAGAYRELEKQYGSDVAVAVRSSATAEDLPTASFAGQHESYLHIRGEEDLFEACRRCFASLFTDRAIVYRVNNGFDHFKVALSVGVMKMVRSDRASSGVIFTLDTESGFRDVVFVTGSYGLGENVVQGKVDPDEFHVHKPTFRQGHRAVLRRELGRKQLTMVLAQGHTGATTRDEPTPPEAQASYCLTDPEVLTLADYAIRIEEHYSAAAGHPQP